MDLDELGRKLRALEARLDRAEASARLSHASIDNTSVQVRDGSGGLRGLIGVQADGTTAVNVVNGPPPPQPSPPAVASVLGGVSAGWDGTFTGGAVLPLDWSRTEVHASTTDAFAPTAATLCDTIETAQGATIVVPTNDPVYVRLVARSTSGTASAPSDTVGPVAKSQVVADDVKDGIVTTVKLAEDAVTAANLAPGAVDATAIADAAVLANKLADNAVKIGKIDAGAVTLNALGGALSDSAKQRYVDAMGEAAAWTTVGTGTGATWQHLTGVADAPTGQSVGQAAGFVQLLGTTVIPYEPGVLYRVSARVRLTVAGSGGTDSMFIGVAGRAADGATLVNRLGTTGSLNSHTYPAASNKTITTGDGWVTVVGYLNGRAATGASGSAGPNNDPRSPGVMHADVRYLSPYLWLNYAEQAVANSPSRMQVDAVTIEALKTGVVDSTNLVAGSVTTAALATDAVTAGKVAADAISARELQVNSVTAAELAAGSVTAQAIAAGSISTEKLTVTAASSIVQKLYDSGGEASAWRSGGTSTTTATTIANLTSVSVTDAQTGSTVMRAVGAVSGAWRPDVLIPFDPNVLYRISATVRQTVAGTNTAQQRVYVGVAGVDANGVLVNADGAASTGSQHYVAAASLNLTAGAGFQRVTGYLKGYAASGASGSGAACPQPTAPGVLHAKARFITPFFYANYESGTGTAEINMFTVEVVESGAVQSVNIADGAITAPKIVAGAVQAGAIAASAVTTAKLDALAVTADKIAANAITADKILAGSITATALSATAIDGKTITGAYIRTATTGQRVTVNEGNQNMVLVYDAAGVPVGELSWRGLRVQGDNGALIFVDPDATFPNVRWSNAGQTNWAYAQVVEPTVGDANLELTSGAFTGNSYTDMRWRLYLANDAVNLERLRGTAPTTRIGGRFWASPTYAQIGYANTDAPTTQSMLTVESGVATLDQARFQAIAAPSAFSVLYGEAPTAHTGPLARLVRGGTERFSVDKDGNTTVYGKLTASNMITGSVSITPSAAGVPTSFSINYSTLPGTVFRGFATAQTTVPGDRTPTGNAGVTGVSMSDVTATSALVWVNRQNTTSTTVHWQVISY